MRILFDQGVPLPLRQYLQDHFVRLAEEEGWDQLTNGKLLNAAEGSGFELLLTTDKQMRYQQNMSGRQIAVRVLGVQQWPDLKPHAHLVTEAVDSVTPGTFAVVEIPSA